MLTPRQNLLETIHGGKPDRFVSQYDFCKYFFNPVLRAMNNPAPGEIDKVNAWGITRSWAPGQPGAFPNHEPDKIVIKDMEDWKEYVKGPSVIRPEAEWEPFVAQMEEVDRNEWFVCCQQHPGLFEQCHYLMEIKNCLMNFYEYPDEMHDLIKYLADWEIRLADECIKYLHPDALFHHDDWGTQISTFMSPDMFAEFFVEPYKEVYGYWKQNGVEIIIHHSDSYAQTIVPCMIEMGIDIWQGTMDTNDICAIEQQYGGQITCMGGINASYVDFEGSTYEDIEPVVFEKLEAYGNDGHYFIPCNTQGSPSMTIFPNVYANVNKAIEAYSPIYWEKHGLNAE